MVYNSEKFTTGRLRFFKRQFYRVIIIKLSQLIIYKYQTWKFLQSLLLLFLVQILKMRNPRLEQQRLRFPGVISKWWKCAFDSTTVTVLPFCCSRSRYCRSRTDVILRMLPSTFDYQKSWTWRTCWCFWCVSKNFKREKTFVKFTKYPNNDDTEI